MECLNLSDLVTALIKNLDDDATKNIISSHGGAAFIEDNFYKSIREKDEDLKAIEHRKQKLIDKKIALNLFLDRLKKSK